MSSSISVEEVAKRASSSDLPNGAVPKRILPFLKSEHSPHRVEIAEPFYLSENEVTQQQYDNVMGLRPWRGEMYLKEGPEVTNLLASRVQRGRIVANVPLPLKGRVQRTRSVSKLPDKSHFAIREGAPKRTN
ncbi:MAG: hypothetical protein KDB11_30640 [Planctomycetales bacterium]|nr:hypothetical protein [Planctomycetales bacterium]